jgi:hypothetical protein
MTLDVPTLRKHLSSPKIPVRLYSLRILEKIDKNEFIPMLIEIESLAPTLENEKHIIL